MITCRCGRARGSANDAAYTLCVCTGTWDIDAALIAARYQLPVPRTTLSFLPGPAHPRRLLLACALRHTHDLSRARCAVLSLWSEVAA
ncbi:DUF5133 domain-containing protein [Streptomyces olivochromogenes]|nr:DUF5133 domain-containing protein [Streptomyces olivochromogenes]